MTTWKEAYQQYKKEVEEARSKFKIEEVKDFIEELDNDGMINIYNSQKGCSMNVRKVYLSRFFFGKDFITIEVEDQDD